MKKPAKSALRMVTNYAKSNAARKKPTKQMKPWTGFCTVEAATGEAFPAVHVGVGHCHPSKRHAPVLVTELGTPHPDTAKVEKVRSHCQELRKRFRKFQSAHGQTAFLVAGDILRILSAKGAKR